MIATRASRNVIYLWEIPSVLSDFFASEDFSLLGFLFVTVTTILSFLFVLAVVKVFRNNNISYRKRFIWLSSFVIFNMILGFILQIGDPIAIFVTSVLKLIVILSYYFLTSNKYERT